MHPPNAIVRLGKAGIRPKKERKKDLRNLRTIKSTHK
jgi:hypothetical protein